MPVLEDDSGRGDGEEGRASPGVVGSLSNLTKGMDVPAELAERFKFARQKSKLAGTIRGSFFIIKGQWKY